MVNAFPIWSTAWGPSSKPAKAATPAKPTKATEPLVGGIEEQMQMGQAKTQYDAGKALRQYQLDSARMNLARNLETIDRSAMDQYKAIANDYAARGMQRSGGFVQAQDTAQANAALQALAAQQSVGELEKQTQLEDVQALANLQGIDYNILQQYIAALMANKINKMGQ